MRKVFLFVICFFSITAVYSQKDSIGFNIFKKLKYDTVIAYGYDGSYGQEQQLIIEKDKLSKKVKNKKILNQEQVKKINKTLIDTSTYGNTTASCFEPHLGIVYYYKNKVVLSISICLQCNFLESSIEIPASIYYKIQSLDNSYSPATGFSKKARKEINDFCKSLNFNYCLDKLDQQFDE